MEAKQTDLESRLRTTEDSRQALAARQTALQAELSETRSRLSGQETTASDLRRELATTRGQLAEKEKQVSGLEEESAGLRQTLALTRLEVSQAGADEIAAYQSRISALEADLAATVEQYTPRLPESPESALPTTIPVLEVGPDNAFVILGFGGTNGARPNHLLEIRRGTESLATVLITGVHPNHAIAQVRPNTLRAGLHKGDLATITSSP